MRFLRLFRSGKDINPVGPGAQDQMERLLADAFRSLGALFVRAAEAVEAQRLSRSGYGDQGKFLERSERPGQPPTSRP